MMDIKGVLQQRFINLFDKKSSGKAVKNRIKSNKELAEELHKDIKKAEKRKICSSFIGNI